MTRTERLKHVADVAVSNVDKKSADGEVAVRLCNYVDVYYHGSISDDLPFMAATATRAQARAFSLLRGDVLITKDSETPDDIAVPAIVQQDLPGVVCGYHLARIRPRSSRVHGAYLYWVIASTPSREWFSASATGVTRFGLRQDAIGNLGVPVPSHGDQTAIAEYLNTETARIDALIEKKRHMLELLAERRQAEIDQAVMEGVRVRVRHVIQRITSGPRGWATRAADDGVIFLRIANINRRDLELDMRNVVRVDAPDGSERDRTRVREGDVLISITADIGSVGVARGDHAGASISQHVALMTPRRCTGDWLAFSLSSTAAQAQLDQACYGGTKVQLALDDVRDVVIHVPDPDAERRVLLRLVGVLERLRAATAALEEQIGLLSEHRQALITAAVAGELKIPGPAA